MPFYKHLLEIRDTVKKKLACCTKDFIEQEVLNAQLSAIATKLDQLDAKVTELSYQKKSKKAD
jgi:hypothetical protein